MQTLKRFLPLAISLILTPFAFVIGIGTAVEGDLFYTKLVFPYATLLLAFVHSLPNNLHISAFKPELEFLFLGLSVVQLPIYGAILSFATDKPPVIVKIAAIHICSSAV